MKVISSRARRVMEREIAGLISRDEAQYILNWPIASDYEVRYGVIYPKDDWQAERRHATLTDPNFFLSFARLGAYDNPSEDPILRWVREHGLLKRADALSRGRNLEKDKTVQVGHEVVTIKAGDLNQVPMRVGDFLAEAQQAYSCLTLLESIRSNNIQVLRRRISSRPVQLRASSGEVVTTKMVALDGELIPYCGGLSDGDELADERLLVTAQCALEFVVESKLEDVRLTFTPDFKHPRPLSTTRPRLAPYCPDLLSALYYQFARLMADERPLTNCVVCGLPILRTRSNRQTCGDTCRKEKSRRSNTAQSDAGYP